MASPRTPCKVQQQYAISPHAEGTAARRRLLGTGIQFPPDFPHILQDKYYASVRSPLGLLLLGCVSLNMLMTQGKVVKFIREACLGLMRVLQAYIFRTEE